MLHTPSWLDIAKQLSSAVEQSLFLQDQRAESYAQGSLGELYEKTGQFSEAQDLTEKALFKAQTINASDITYQWQWQLGRLLNKKGDIKGAIAPLWGTAVKLRARSVGSSEIF